MLFLGRALYDWLRRGWLLALYKELFFEALL